MFLCFEGFLINLQFFSNKDEIYEKEILYFYSLNFYFIITNKILNKLIINSEKVYIIVSVAFSLFMSNFTLVIRLFVNCFYIINIGF